MGKVESLRLAARTAARSVEKRSWGIPNAVKGAGKKQVLRFAQDDPIFFSSALVGRRAMDTQDDKCLDI